MMLALPPLRLVSAAIALALVASARGAAAQTPPADLPPLPLPGAAPVGPATAPPTAGRAPGTPVTPPVAPPLPAGYGYPYGYGAPPPGYGQPGGYPYPTASPYYPREGIDPNVIPPPLPRRRYDNGLFAGGVIAVVSGMTSVLIGAYLVSSGSDRIEIYCDTPPSTPCAHKNDAPRMTAGALMMGLGAAVGAAGLPMWFVGSRFVTLTTEEQKKQAFQPEVRVGAGSASVSLRF